MRVCLCVCVCRARLLGEVDGMEITVGHVGWTGTSFTQTKYNWLITM